MYPWNKEAGKKKSRALSHALSKGRRMLVPPTGKEEKK
jgi:hypothetical protein